MATDIEICNNAISLVRGRNILTLEDDSMEARICKARYPAIRDSLLRGHPWNFNKQRVTLALLLETPAFEYGLAYQVPSDCAKILKTNIPVEISWALEQGKLLTNYADVAILYGKFITDTSKFDAQFVEVLTYALAADICYSITQSNPRTEQLTNEAKAKLREARSMNGQERGSVEQVGASEWLNARF